MTAHTKDLQEHRSYFPALSNKAYFNFGGQGVLPKQSVSAIFCSYDYIQTNGPFSSRMFGWLQDEVRETKQQLAREFGVDELSIALTQSVTEGCNIAMWGIDWQAGDHLMLTDSEHPSVIAIAEAIAERFKVEVSFVPVSDFGVDAVSAIRDNLQPRTRMVALSHVLWNTGRVLPIADIAKLCHERDIKILVDGAQSAGVMPLNFTTLDVDFYAVTGHKWMCGPEGVGALYIRPQLVETLLPTFVGWRGVEMISEGKPDATKFEVATVAFPLFAGLRAALQVHNEWASTSERHEQIKRNVKYLSEQLAEVPGLKLISQPQGAGLIAFEIAGKKPTEIVRKLEADRIMVRSIPLPYCVRASVHYLTDKRDMDRLAMSLSNW